VPVEIVYGTLDPFLMPASMKIVERMRHVTVSRVDANDHVIRRRLAKVVAEAIA
jgi:cis-3-alkyl-4-acyloxetan-2-one decarboxylase